MGKRKQQRKINTQDPQQFEDQISVGDQANEQSLQSPIKSRKRQGQIFTDEDGGKKKSKKKSKQKKKTNSEIWQIYKTFFAYTLKRWQWGLACLIVTLLSGFFQSIFPLKLGQLLDVIANQTNNNIDGDQFKKNLTSQMLFLGSLTVIIGVAIFARYITLQLFQQQLAMDLKCDIYNIFMQNDLNFFEIHQSNALVSRLSSDVNQAKSAISNNLTMLLRNIVLCISSLIILVAMSWKCTLIMLSIIPFYSYITVVYKNKAKQLIKQRQDVQAEIAIQIGQKFAGIQAIKSFGTQKKQMQKYRQLNSNVYDLNKKRTLYQGIHSTCSTFLPSLGSLFVLLFAGIKILQGDPQLTSGQLTSFILYCTMLSRGTSSISNSYTNIINGTSAIQRVFEMMNYKKLIEEDVGKQVNINGDIQFQAVDFTYPSKSNLENNSQQELQEKSSNIETNANSMNKMKEQQQSETETETEKQTTETSLSTSLQPLGPQIFNKLSFKINKGEYVGFVGQSGSGKSTIIKLIQHFYGIQGGRILFGEHSSKDINIKYLRKQIGVVSQQANIFSGTIEQNITYGSDNYTQEELQEVTKKSGCYQFINNQHNFPNGFKTVVGERGNKISGGQKQRISIARALLRKPKILLFDQATSALDSHSQQIVQKSIEKLAKDHQLTIAVVAHRLSTVINCDRLFVMKQGQIIQEGSHRELIKRRGYYFTLIQKQLHETDDQDLQTKIGIDNGTEIYVEKQNITASKQIQKVQEDEIQN